MFEAEHCPEDFVPLYPFAKAGMKIIRERISRERKAKRRARNNPAL